MSDRIWLNVWLRIADRARRVALEHLTAELSAQRWAEWLREICPVVV